MINKHPDSPKLHKALASSYIMSGYQGRDMYQEAYNELKRTIQLDPMDSDLYSLLSMTIDTKKVEAEPSESIKALQKAIELDPSKWNYYHALGAAYWKMNKLPEAKLSFETALKMLPHEEKIVIRQLKDWIEAIKRNASYWEAATS